ncbi:equilibrative nucleoside transporter 4 [Rhipicephalus sanguineus]|uniref:equilibrative nucleoside transporter 4 n=1 Tax=Rhipicephalus sanguineus TaxID=34632 RepID=UPI00189454A3|nr:equilibrative nucleoside transporter 4 [Rhipicephalus sanguineus]
MDENLSRGYIQLGRQRVVLKQPGSPLAPSHERPPEDRCSCVYLALVLAGVGFLLPYNSFITAVDYFQDKYPRTTIVFDMNLVYILTAFLAVVVNNLLVETLPLQVRITFGYLLSFATLLFVALVEVHWESFEHDVGYTANLVAIAIVALGCTVQQSSFYGYTSMLPSRYTQAVMTGESAAGVLVSANRILTKALLRDERLNTLLFFLVSVTVVMLCFVIHLVLHRTRFVRFYLDLCAAAAEEGKSDGDDVLHSRILLEPTEDVGLVDMLDPVESKTGKYGVLSLRTPPASPTSTAGGADFESSDVLDDEESIDARRRGGYITDDTTRSLWSGRMSASLGGSGDVASCGAPSRRGLVGASVGAGSDELSTSGLKGVNCRVQEVVVRMRRRTHGRPPRLWSGIKRGLVARYQVGRKVWPYMISMALVYMVTLSLFPGIESRIVSCRLGSWMPVLLMALFNAADFIGKVLASVRYDWSRSQLVWLSCSRVVLVPLLALCALPRWYSSTGSDLWAMALSAALGVTNGLLGSLPMILAPGRVPDDQKELTGNIMTLSYSVGLTTGSGLAYLLVYLIQGYDFGGPDCSEHFPSTPNSLNETSWLTLASANATRHLQAL